MSAAAASAASPLASSSALSLCWAFDLGAFRRSGAGTGAPFEALLALVENDASEKTRIMRFHFPQDRQRALLGRMAMRAALTRMLGVQHADLHLARSAYGKPFVQQPPQAEQTVAFNVSHHGQYVVLAAEAHVNAADGGADGTSTASALPPLLGCDVTTCDRPPNCASISEYLNDMQSCFTANEWELIHADGSHDGPLPIDLSDALESGKVTENEARALVRFAWMWSLKESLIKAIGMGLSFELQHIEFFFPDAQCCSLFSPVSVRFLGAPTFESAADAALQTAAAASSSPSAAQVRPPELADGLDVARDVRWTFSSAMLMDEKHIVTVCKGVRIKGTDGKRDDEVTTPSSMPSLPDGTISVAAVPHVLQLAQLGHNISRAAPAAAWASAADTSSAQTASSHLQVRQLSHVQITPPHAPAQPAPAPAAAAVSQH